MDIYATAKVYRSTRKILFVEGVAYSESREKPIARAIGSWVRVASVDLSWLHAAELGNYQE
jgi:acyl-coenzyme A thioesterase PaaI-like protein